MNQNATMMPDSWGNHRTVPAPDSPALLSTGAIIGIVCGGIGLLFVLALVVLCCFCYKKRRRRSAAAREHELRAPSIPRRADPPQETTGISMEQAGAGADGNRDEARRSNANEAEGVLDRSRAISTRGDDVDSGCPLCRSAYDIEIGERPASLDCSHRFHQRCIERWKKVNRCCPICNATQISFSGQKEIHEASTSRTRHSRQGGASAGPSHRQTSSDLMQATTGRELYASRPSFHL